MIPKKDAEKLIQVTAFNKIAEKSNEIIDTLYKLMKESKMDAVRVSAAKELLSRILPILRHTEHSGTVGHTRVLSDKEYEDTLRAGGIDPKTGRRLGVTPTEQN